MVINFTNQFGTVGWVETELEDNCACQIHAHPTCLYSQSRTQ